MSQVTLAWSEVMMAAEAGVLRNVQSLQRGRQNANGLSAELNWQVNIEGCLGELAVAKYLGVYWSGKGIFRGGDVGDYQVRTAAGDGYSLILHPGDADEAIFILVVGQAPNYRVVGWLYGEEGKHRRYWRDPKGGRPAYFVPQADLRPMEILPIPANSLTIRSEYSTIP